MVVLPTNAAMGVSWKLVSVHSTGKHCILNGEHHDKQLDIHLRMIMMTSRESLMRAFRGTFNHVVFLYTVYGYPRIGLPTGQKSYSSGFMAIPQEMATVCHPAFDGTWPRVDDQLCPYKIGMIFQVACETQGQVAFDVWKSPLNQSLWDAQRTWRRQ